MEHEKTDHAKTGVGHLWKVVPFIFTTSTIPSWESREDLKKMGFTMQFMPAMYIEWIKASAKVWSNWNKARWNWIIPHCFCFGNGGCAEKCRRRNLDISGSVMVERVRTKPIREPWRKCLQYAVTDIIKNWCWRRKFLPLVLFTWPKEIKESRIDQNSSVTYWILCHLFGSGPGVI